MNRAGEYIIVLDGVAQYKAYKSNPLPLLPELEMDSEMVYLLAKAHLF